MAVTWKKLVFSDEVTLNTDTDVSGNSWVLDEDSFSSNSATKVPTQQSTKAYIDSKVGRSIYGGSDTFNGSTGVTVSIGATLSGTNYAVSIIPTGDAIDVGAIHVESKTTTGFVVKCTGTGTPTFDWVLVGL